MRQTARNRNYIRRLHARGLPPGTIYLRVLERMTWDGPLPSVDEISAIIGSPHGETGPAVSAGDNAGAAGPGMR